MMTPSEKIDRFIKRNPRLALYLPLLLAVIGWLLSSTSLANPVFIYLSWIIWIIAFVVGIRVKRLLPHSTLIVNLGIALSVFLAISITYIFADIKIIDNSYCKNSMLIISEAIKDHCEQNDGNFPEVSKWCDILISERGKYPPIDKSRFRCPDVKEGLSGYAINKNLEGKKWNEIDPNTIILFEAVSGWNRNGGKELIRFNKHSFPPALKKFNVVCRGTDSLIFKTVTRSKNLRWEP